MFHLLSYMAEEAKPNLTIVQWCNNSFLISFWNNSKAITSIKSWWRVHGTAVVHLGRQLMSQRPPLKAQTWEGYSLDHCYTSITAKSIISPKLPWNISTQINNIYPWVNSGKDYSKPRMFLPSFHQKRDFLFLQMEGLYNTITTWLNFVIFFLHQEWLKYKGKMWVNLTTFYCNIFFPHLLSH